MRMDKSVQNMRKQSACEIPQQYVHTKGVLQQRGAAEEGPLQRENPGTLRVIEGAYKRWLIGW